MIASEPNSPLRVVMAAPDPRHPGGITSVIASWRRAGLGRAVELVELPTSAMDSSLPAKLWSAARALGRLVWMQAFGPRPDLVHLHSSTGGSLWRKLALAWCCRLGRVPYVVQMHSGGFEPWLAASRLNRAAARSLFAHAATAIVLGERWVAPARALGAPRVEVVPNGISESERRTLAGVMRSAAEHREAGDPALLLFYGRWAPVKGADRLAGALRELGRDDYEVRLFGNGDRRWLEEQFRGLPGAVSIGGWLGGERKLAELGRADAVVAPSRREGLPVALLEARAASVPVIATDVGAVAGVLAGYPDALLLDADDDRGLREAISILLDGEWPASAGSRVEPGELPIELRSEHAVERLVEIYRAAVAGGG